MTEPGLSHVDESNRPAMVDVGEKAVTRREARAEALVRLPREVRRLFEGSEIQSKKGPVFATAIIAGTMAVKKTSELIPFCHPLPIDACRIEIDWNEDVGARVLCTVKVEAKTGVEMEALTGASVAALTIYDMCKAVSHEIEITALRLLEKSGGKSAYVKRA